jgi:hypothetical protein
MHSGRRVNCFPKQEEKQPGVRLMNKHPPVSGLFRTLVAITTIAIAGSAHADVIDIDVATVGDLSGTNDSDEFNFNAALSGTASGLAGDDVFNINDGGSTGGIDGGSGADTVSYANRSGAVSTAVDAFANVESLVGSGSDDTLQGTVLNDAFVVTAADAGTANGVTFESFENLDGLDGDDTFTLNASLSGTIDGGAGSDTLVTADDADIFNVNAANAGTVNGTAFENIENLDGGNGADSFSINASLSGTASGGAGNDTFSINDGGSAGSIGGGAGIDVVSYAGRTSGANVDLADFDAVELFIGSAFEDTFNLNGDQGGILIEGGAGIDLFAVVSNSQISGDLVVVNVEDAVIGANVSANNITLSVGGNVTQNVGTAINAGELTLTSVGGATLTEGNDVDTLNATNSGGGDIQYTDVDDLSVTGISNTNSNVILEVGGNLFIDGGINVGTGSLSLVGSDTVAIGANIVAGDLTVSGFDTLLLALLNDLIFIDGTIDFGVNNILFDASGIGVADGMMFDIIDASFWDLTVTPDFMVTGLAGGYFLDTDSFFTDGIVTTRLLDPVSVPEPGTLALLGIGLAALGLSRRRKTA